MKRNQMHAVILSAALMCSGCGAVSEQETTEGEANTEIGTSADEIASSDLAEAENIIELNVFSQMASGEGEQKGWFADVLLEKFNVKLNYWVDEEDIVEKSDIICWGSTGGEYRTAVQDGLLLNWNDSLQAAQYAGILDDDGNIYAIRSNCPAAKQDVKDYIYVWELRWDIYEKLGCPPVSDLDDYVQLLEDMKEFEVENGEENGIYAFSLWKEADDIIWDENLNFHVKCFVGAYFGYPSTGFDFYNQETEEYYDCLMENGPYLESLKFFNTLYQKGLLDPDSARQSYDNAVSKMADGKVLASLFAYSGSEIYNSEEHIEKNQMLLPLVPETARVLAYGLDEAEAYRVWTVGANSKHKEICMELIDWLYSPEGILTYYYGPQGVCWDYDDEGYLYLTDLGIACLSDRQTEMKDGYSGSFGEGAPMFNMNTAALCAVNTASKYGECYDAVTWKKMQAEPGCETERIWRENYADASSVFEFFQKRCKETVFAASVSGQAEHGETGTEQWKQVAQIIQKGSWEAIYAENDEEFERIVADMTEEAKNAGYEQCIHRNQ